MRMPMFLPFHRHSASSRRCKRGATLFNRSSSLHFIRGVGVERHRGNPLAGLDQFEKSIIPVSKSRTLQGRTKFWRSKKTTQTAGGKFLPPKKGSAGRRPPADLINKGSWSLRFLATSLVRKGSLPAASAGPTHQNWDQEEQGPLQPEGRAV
jgi:hypothetical protein